MDQVKVGKFIAECRKEKKLTQMQLAEKLNITNRAVSKWETGKSMPDTSVMLELCEILGISVNELLSGKRLNMEKYMEEAEVNLMELLSITKSFRKLRFVAQTLMLSGIILALTFPSTLEMTTISKVIMCCTGIFVFVCGFILDFSIKKEEAKAIKK